MSTRHMGTGAAMIAMRQWFETFDAEFLEGPAEKHYDRCFDVEVPATIIDIEPGHKMFDAVQGRWYGPPRGRLITFPFTVEAPVDWNMGSMLLDIRDKVWDLMDTRMSEGRVPMHVIPGFKADKKADHRMFRVRLDCAWLDEAVGKVGERLFIGRSYVQLGWQMPEGA